VTRKCVPRSPKKSEMVRDWSRRGRTPGNGNHGTTISGHLGEPTEIPGITESPAKDRGLTAECFRGLWEFERKHKINATSEAPQGSRERSLAAAIPRLQPICDCPNFWERVPYDHLTSTNEHQIHLPDPVIVDPDT
jgi:hypothetical protein